MNRNILGALALSCSGLLGNCLQSATAAGFIEDSKANLQLRNYYFNDDFKDEAGMSAKGAASAKSKKEEWAQGFLLDTQSGFTQGTLGFGLDALGLLGVKLDSGGGRAGTALLPLHDDGHSASEFSSLGITAKARFAQTLLKHGTLQPKLPVLIRNDARIVPQTFEGTQVSSTDIQGLSLTGGYLDQFKMRDSSDNRSIVADGFADERGAGFYFAGADYKVKPALSLSYYYGELEEFYRQHFAGVIHTMGLGPGTLTSDLRYFHSNDSGEARGGAVDNQMLSGQLTYGLSGHSIGAGYQRLSGDGGLPYVSGATVYSFSNAGIGKFVEEQERTWMLSYGYDFKNVGVPGLTFLIRYLNGHDGQTELRGSTIAVKEWERDSELAYTFGDGALKGFGVKLRNYAYRSNFSRGRDNNRIYLTYDIALW